MYVCMYVCVRICVYSIHTSTVHACVFELFRSFIYNSSHTDTVWRLTNYKKYSKSIIQCVETNNHQYYSAVQLSAENRSTTVWILQCSMIIYSILYSSNQVNEWVDIYSYTLYTPSLIIVWLSAEPSSNWQTYKYRYEYSMNMCDVDHH